MKYNIFIIFLTACLFAGCGLGISPEPEVVETKTGFGGTITFKGNWPQGIKRTHVVAFKNPLNSIGDFNAYNLGFVSDSIPNNTRSIFFSSLKNPLIEIKAGEYSYVAVAQSKTSEISISRKDWVVVGIFYTEGDSTNPGKLLIKDDEFTGNINFICDFDNPPPQPPGGN